MGAENFVTDWWGRKDAKRMENGGNMFFGGGKKAYWRKQIKYFRETSGNTCIAKIMRSAFK